MSIKLMTAVWENDQTKGSERLVLLAFADMANDQGVCWPSYETVAKKANIDRRNVIKHVKSLIDKGLLSKKARFRKNGKEMEYTSNYYIINTPPPMVVTEPSPPSDGDDTTPSDGDDTTLVTGASPKPSLNPKIDPPINLDDNFSILARAFEGKTSLFNNGGNLDKGYAKLLRMKATPEEVEDAIDILVDIDYRISNPGSLEKTIANMRMKKKKLSKGEIMRRSVEAEGYRRAE